MGKEQEVISVLRKQVTPSSEERKKVVRIQQDILKKIKVPHAVAMVGGSGAKGTWLEGTHDIDVYVKFAYSTYKHRSDELSEVLYKAIKKKFPRVLRVHGSRDYFQVSHKGCTIEIVPILAITKASQAENITDFSFFHVKYVKDKIKKKKSLADDIRVAKVFLKANRLYGAESYLKGLSGYGAELLLCHYGSFKRFVHAVASWKQTTLIGSKKRADALNWAKKQSPLIIVDPVQPDRNATAAFGSASYGSLKKACQRFVKNPSVTLFEREPIDVMKLQKKGHLMIISGKAVSKKRDIAGAKALKAFEHIIRHLDVFSVVHKVFEYEDSETTWYIVTQKETLPKEFKHYGPPTTNHKAYVAFKKANKRYPIKIDRKKKKYYVVKKRKYFVLRDVVKQILQQEEVQSRVKNICLLE